MKLGIFPDFRKGDSHVVIVEVSLFWMVMLSCKDIPAIVLCSSCMSGLEGVLMRVILHEKTTQDPTQLAAFIFSWPRLHCRLRNISFPPKHYLSTVLDTVHVVHRQCVISGTDFQ